ncbi:MAG: hypothetical protein MUE63_11605 [Xanthomonadales bacterium]|nr:hypothetical protein [Xanthomonadales bacterium]
MFHARGTPPRQSGNVIFVHDIWTTGGDIYYSALFPHLLDTTLASPQMKDDLCRSASPSCHPAVGALHSRDGIGGFRPRPTTIALAVCALLGSGGHAWAACTAAPSGATLSAGLLAPASGDTVNCTALTEAAIVNTAATGTTVTVAAGGEVRSATLQAPAIALGAGVSITNAGRLFADRPGDASVSNGGAVTIRGAGNTINNSGTIEARDGTAIQGLISGDRATGTVLINSGVIRNTNDTAASGHAAVNIGDNAQVTNLGTIEMRGGGAREALVAGAGSQIDNQASGVIRAVETRTYTSGGFVRAGASGVLMKANSTLVNAGRIEASAPISGFGDAVNVIDTGAAITNSGTIDGTAVAYAINMSGPVNTTGTVSVTNSGTILGGSRGAIDILEGNGAVVTLDTGSQITGSVTVRDAAFVPKTDAELGDQRLIDLGHGRGRRPAYRLQPDRETRRWHLVAGHQPAGRVGRPHERLLPRPAERQCRGCGGATQPDGRDHRRR